jgi:hypothetical protein
VSLPGSCPGHQSDGGSNINGINQKYVERIFKEYQFEGMPTFLGLVLVLAEYFSHKGMEKGIACLQFYTADRYHIMWTTVPCVPKYFGHGMVSNVRMMHKQSLKLSWQTHTLIMNDRHSQYTLYNMLTHVQAKGVPLHYVNLM